MSGLSSTRAKFSCVEIVRVADSDTITFRPVISGSAENREFFKWTPAGSIVLGVVGSAVSRQFEVGRDYYVDFTPAPELEP
jgi:hypothetical protein